MDVVGRQPCLSGRQRCLERHLERLVQSQKRRITIMNAFMYQYHVTIKLFEYPQDIWRANCFIVIFSTDQQTHTTPSWNWSAHRDTIYILLIMGWCTGGVLARARAHVHPWPTAVSPTAAKATLEAFSVHLRKALHSQHSKSTHTSCAAMYLPSRKQVGSWTIKRASTQTSVSWCHTC